MKRFHLLTAFMVLFPAFLFAGEGMWIPMLLQYNEKERERNAGDGHENHR